MPMTLQEIYNFFIEQGIKHDPRPHEEIRRLLKEEKEAFKKLTSPKKDFFDQERLTNPYADTRILNGDHKKKINKIAVGIDLEVGELLLVNELNKSGAGIDLALSHHPEGIALARLDAVMRLQEELYAREGVPINVIESLMDKEVARVMRSVHPINHNANVDIARILQIAYMCAHTVADNMAYQYVNALMQKKKPRTLGDAMDLLLGEPEFAASAKRGVPPITFVGSEKSRAGKIAVTGFTGGTSGSADVYESLKFAGVGTEIAMHMKPEAQKEAEKHHINVIIAGHIASDSLGLNLLLDQLQKKSKIQIMALGGFTRFKR